MQRHTQSLSSQSAQAMVLLRDLTAPAFLGCN
jgi:hypothetical protein